MRLIKTAFLTVLFTAALSFTAAAFAAATSSKAVTYEEKTVNGVKLKVVVVDQKDPSIGLKVSLTDNRLEHTKPFDAIVKEEAAIVSINGNFFEAYNKEGHFVPIGNVMSGGELIHSSAGTPNIGFTSDNSISFGMPGFFIYLITIPRNTGEAPFSFLAYDTNVRGQQAKTARLYTPFYGAAVEITYPGTVYVFESNVFKSFKKVAKGEVIDIPANGCVLFHSSDVPEYNVPKDPKSLIGAKVAQEYRLYNPDKETKSEFKDTGIVSLMAGNARLVANGSSAAAARVYGAENDSRWTSAAPRTAIGELKDGKLLLVSTESATMKKLADALVQLGCVNAVNLDGGGSTAMAIDGKITARPGRNLAVTFHVVNKAKAALPMAKESGFTPRYTEYAKALAKLGLLEANKEGGYDLDKPVTRSELESMMKRFKVSAGDMPPAALSASKEAVTPQTYITFLLRALKYPEGTGGAFTYEKSVQYAQTYFLLTPSVTYYEWENRGFLRDDMAVLTYTALSIKTKDGRGDTLADVLCKAGAFTARQAAEAGIRLKAG